MRMTSSLVFSKMYYRKHGHPGAIQALCRINKGESGYTKLVLPNCNTSHSFRYPGTFNKDNPPRGEKGSLEGWSFVFFGGFCLFFSLLGLFFSQTLGSGGLKKLHYHLREVLSGGWGHA